MSDAAERQRRAYFAAAIADEERRAAELAEIEQRFTMIVWIVLALIFIVLVVNGR